MSADLKGFYELYCAVESIPARADAAAREAALKRSNALGEAEAAKRKTNQDYDSRSTAARNRHQAAHDGLEAELRAIAESARNKGAIPHGGATGTGSPPDFAQAKFADRRLAEAIEEQRKLRLKEERLQKQLALEKDQAKARVRDALTFCVLGLGLVMAVVAGANALGAIVIIIFTSIGQTRLGNGPSAFMNREASKIPAMFSDARVKSGASRVFAGAYALLATAVTAGANAYLSTVQPFWSGELFWRWMPSESAGTVTSAAIASAVLFWVAAAYALILLTTGYSRRAAAGGLK